MSDEIDEDEEEGFLGSIGFMFDAQHVRLMKTVCFGDNISLKIKLIGEDPGHVQSGQYLWPAAAFTGRFLVDNWATLKASTIIELGAGVGLAGLVASKLPGTQKVVLTDYDHGSLQLLNNNVELNTTPEDTCKITVEFLEWGKTLARVDQCVIPSSSSDRNASDQSSNDRNASDQSSNDRNASDQSSSDRNANDQITINESNIYNNSYFNCDSSSSSSSSNSSSYDNKRVTFSLILGTDLLYCTEIVRPLFKSAKLLMDSTSSACFVLVSSFNPGEDIETVKNTCCKELGLIRNEIIELDETLKICRVEYFKHVQP